MSERTTRDSFIVRVYRYDPKDSRRVTGLIEAVDGSGISASFSNGNELAAIVHRLVSRSRKTREEPESGKQERDNNHLR